MKGYGIAFFHWSRAVIARQERCHDVHAHDWKGFYVDHGRLRKMFVEMQLTAHRRRLA